MSKKPFDPIVYWTSHTTVMPSRKVYALLTWCRDVTEVLNLMARYPETIEVLRTRQRVAYYMHRFPVIFCFDPMCDLRIRRRVREWKEAHPILHKP